MKKHTRLGFSRLCLSLLAILPAILHAQIIFQVDGKAKITVMDTVTDLSANVVRQADGTLALRQYKIGDMAHGGLIFYIDESGEHGLVADTTDLSTGIRWYAGTSGNTRARGDGPFAGEMNTAVIMSSLVAIGDDQGSYAARMCAELQKGGYGDWYLPSKDELNLMYINLHVSMLGGFSSEPYWSSTDIISSFAWAQNFDDNEQFSLNKGSNSRVRAVRAY